MSQECSSANFKPINQCHGKRLIAVKFDLNNCAKQTFAASYIFGLISRYSPRVVSHLLRLTKMF